MLSKMQDCLLHRNSMERCIIRNELLLRPSILSTSPLFFFGHFHGFSTKSAKKQTRYHIIISYVVYIRKKSSEKSFGAIILQFSPCFCKSNFASFYTKKQEAILFSLHFLRYFLKNRIKPPKKFTFCWDNIDKTVQIQVGILTAF